MIGYKSYTAKPVEVEQKWYVIDAKDKVLGHLASELALRLRGKHKVTFTPHVDCGDNIVVINADKLVVTGKKTENKKYYRYTGYVGNLKAFSFEEMMKRSPTKVLQLAVKGMLPRGSLGREMLTKLKVYASPEHPHEAQQPETLTL